MQEAKALLDGEVLGDTRQETKKKKQSLARNSPKTNVASTKRTSTIDKALEEAKAVYNDLDTSGEGRSLRKRSSSSSPKKSPAVKRAGTMLKTAEVNSSNNKNIVLRSVYVIQNNISLSACNIVYLCCVGG